MEELLEKLKIKPNNMDLYNRAFIHSSYAYEHDMIPDYERLEFLGDAVLELVISDYLYKNQDLDEGQMTRMRAAYVCENALYEYALSLNFNEYVKLGHGEERSGGKFRKTILADIFEAFLGAVYLDQGLHKVKEVVNGVIIPTIESENEYFFKDYKTMLQELVQIDQRTVTYELVKESGPPHNKTFKVVVMVDGINFGEGMAKSKKQAEQNAALAALKKQAK
ncbi:MAG: ribonuclease III [Bacilli bacterium]|nr:ribonuclease III [Bacilli bacterium]MDD3305030.1 ribonuclease III [Bacilli bacterium]MDD4053639.1 ribonuclease III [Bacilli bacterium]MDD4411138.1 ribonuclease III [Bacilli bacterium]